MAKQNVTFIERHLEKFVVGVCALAVLVVAWLYLINTPNTVQVGGEVVGPKDYYGQFTDQARAAAERIKRATGRDDGSTPPPTPLTQQPRPYTTLNLNPAFAVAFAPPSPPIPAVGEGPPPGDKQLAEILPPVRPLLTTGRSTAKLPDPQIEQVAVGAGVQAAQPSLAEAAREYSWINVISAVDRKKQRERCTACGYEQRRLALIVTQVQAERQELLPNGQWGAPEAVTGYAPWVVQGPMTLETKDGEILQEQAGLPSRYVSIFERYEKEAEVLRPPVQLLFDDWWQWSTPRQFPGADMTFEELGVFFPPEPVRKGRPANAPAGAQAAANPAPNFDSPAAPGPAGEQDPQATRRAVEALREAKNLVNQKEWIKLEELLKPLIGPASRVPRNMQDDAKKLLDDWADDIKAAYEAKAREEQRRIDRMNLNYGPDLDPLWLTDLSVTAGKTYRYRVRLLALNLYAGTSTLLKSIEDSTRVVLIGQWSEWSDGITAKPLRHLFFRKADDPQVAQVELAEYGVPAWKQSGNVRVGLGQPLAWGTGRSRLSYDGSVLDIQLRQPYRERSVGKGGIISYRDAGETQILTLVNARGDVEERIAADDLARSKRFQTEKSAEQTQRTEMSKVPRPARQSSGGIAPVLQLQPRQGETGRNPEPPPG